MTSWLLAVAAVAFGAAVHRAISSQTDAVARLFCAVVGSVTALAAVSLALARAGLYSPAAAALALGAPAVAILARDRGSTPARMGVEAGGGPDGGSDLDTHRGTALAALLVGLLALYWSYPTTYLLGGRDPGVYAVLAAQIGATGGIDMDLPFLGRVLGRLGDSVEPGYPGVYSMVRRGLSANPNDLDPQFAHLFPALAANAYVPFGVAGLVRVNAVVGTLAVWAVHQVARKYLPFWAAFGVAAGVGLNPAVIWANRITYSEPLAMLLGFFGLFLCLEAVERRSAYWASFGGAVIGLAVFARLDALFGLLVPAGVAAIAMAREPTDRRVARILVLTALAATGAGLLDAWLHTRPYVLDLVSFGLLDKLLILYGVVAVLGPAATLVPMGGRLSAEGIERCLRVAGIVLTLFLCGWFAYVGLVLPSTTVEFEGRLARELSWYVSSVVLGLAPLGALLAAWGRRGRDWFPVLLLAGVTLVAYTWGRLATPDHIWVSRRWVPYFFPLVTLLAVHVVAWMVEGAPRWRRWAAALVGTAIAVAFVSEAGRTARPFLFESMYGGIAEDYRAVTDEIRRRPNRRVVLTDNRQVASVLTYVWRIPTVVGRPPSDEAEAERMKGHLFLAHRGGNRWIEPTRRYPVRGFFLERVVGERPERLVEEHHDVFLGVVATRDERRDRRIASYPVSRLFSHVGIADGAGRTLRSTGKAGFLQYGPYQDLRPGDYLVRWYGRAESACTVRVDVVAGEGSIVWAAHAVDLEPASGTRNLATLVFHLEEEAEGVEFRMKVQKGAEVVLTRVDLFEIGQGDLDPRRFDPDPEPVVIDWTR